MPFDGFVKCISFLQAEHSFHLKVNSEIKAFYFFFLRDFDEMILLENYPGAFVSRKEFIYIYIYWDLMHVVHKFEKYLLFPYIADNFNVN